MSRIDEDHFVTFRTDRRGVSEALAVALLIGIVVTGATVILVFGGDEIDRNEKAIEVSQAEHALVQFDSQTSRVALGETPVQQVDLGVQGSGGALDARSDSGWLRVERVNGSTGQPEQIANASLGAVVYEHGQTTVAYQGGGVWRSDGDGSVMLSRPEIHLRNDTLSMPVVEIQRGGSVYSEVEVSQNGTAVQRFPNESAGLTNKVEDTKIVVTVQSDYYEAWGQYFEDETNALVRYDHDRETATITFLALSTEFKPTNGVIATAGPGTLELKGTGAYVDSYNSTEGTYEDTASSNGSVEAVGDVVISGDAEIAGDVRSGAVVDVEDSAGKIDGDVYWTEDFENDGTVTGNDTRIDGVASVPPIDGYVSQNVEALRASNDNNETAVISQNELSISDSSAELGAGDYYLENGDLQGEDLVLNTTEGDIALGVRDWIKVERDGGTGGNITVRGDGDVKIYVEGQNQVTVSPTGLGERDVNLFVDKGSDVHVPGEQSGQFRVYAQQDFNGTIAGSNGNSAGFDGVIYAPAGESGSGYLYIKHADLYGAAVTGNLTLGQYGAVHFDHTLRETELPLSPTVSRIDYMYLTVHGIDVRDQ